MTQRHSFLLLVINSCRARWGVTRHMTGYHKRMGRVSFRGLKSLARIFFPLLARKSSGFARILLDFFLPENGYLNISRGAGAPLSPMGCTPMLAMHSCQKRLWFQTTLEAYIQYTILGYHSQNNNNQNTTFRVIFCRSDIIQGCKLNMVRYVI